MLGLNYQESQTIVQNFQNSYPYILMLKDTSGSVYGKYRQNGYIPLNYLIDHDLSQSVVYWSEGYSHSTMLNKINATVADVTANLAPDASSYPRGGTLGFDVEVTNWIAANRYVYMLLDIEMPAGNYYPVQTTPLNLTPSEFRIIRKDLPIPMSAPIGSYMLRVRLGMPPADLWNLDTADFNITP